MRTHEKYIKEVMISAKDSKVFKRTMHSKVKDAYNQVDWAIKNMEMENMTKKGWFEVKFLLDKVLERIVTIK